MVEPQGRSSRTATHNRPVLVLPRPGLSTGTGVSSAWIASPYRTWWAIVSASGTDLFIYGYNSGYIRDHNYNNYLLNSWLVLLSGSGRCSGGCYLQL